MIDITGADIVEVLAGIRGKVLWVNVNGICELRICRIKRLEINDNREMNPPKLGRESAE